METSVGKNYKAQLCILMKLRQKVYKVEFNNVKRREKSGITKTNTKRIYL